MIYLTPNHDDLRALTPSMRSSLIYLINHGNANGASTAKEAVKAVVVNGNKAFLSDLTLRLGSSYALFALVNVCIIPEEV